MKVSDRKKQVKPLVIKPYNANNINLSKKEFIEQEEDRKAGNRKIEEYAKTIMKDLTKKAEKEVQEEKEVSSKLKDLQDELADVLDDIKVIEEDEGDAKDLKKRVKVLRMQIGKEKKK